MLQEPKDTEETREKKTEEVIEMQAIASASQKEMEIICALSVLIFSNYLYCFNCLHQSKKFSLIGLIDWYCHFMDFIVIILHKSLLKLSCIKFFACTVTISLKLEATFWHQGHGLQ